MADEFMWVGGFQLKIPEVSPVVTGGWIWKG